MTSKSKQIKNPMTNKSKLTQVKSRDWKEQGIYNHAEIKQTGQSSSAFEAALNFCQDSSRQPFPIKTTKQSIVSFQEKMFTGKRCVSVFLLLVAISSLIEDSEEITGILILRTPRFPTKRLSGRNHCGRRCRRHMAREKTPSFQQLMR